MTAIPPETKSPRRVLMGKIRELFETVRGGAYYVKRGPINWGTYSFEDAESRRAVALLMDDQTFLAPENEADLSFELAAAMPDATQKPEVDDGLLDELIDDAVWVIRTLTQSIDDRGDSIVLFTNQKESRIVEFHDPSLLVQGIVVTLFVKF